MSNSGNENRLPDQGTLRQRRPRKNDSPPGQLPPYHVVLLNDDDHTYDYVVEMLSTIFGHNPRKGKLMADQLNPQGRVIVLTTHKELAELKREQIHAFGKDWRLDKCAGSMSAVVEAAE